MVRIFKIVSTKLKIQRVSKSSKSIKSDNPHIYSSNYITKKETKSDDRLSKFDWHDLSPIFLNIMLLHNLKVF